MWNGRFVKRLTAVFLLISFFPDASPFSQLMNKEALLDRLLETPADSINTLDSYTFGYSEPFDPDSYLIIEKDSIITSNVSVKKIFTRRFTGSRHFYITPLEYQLEKSFGSYIQNRLNTVYTYSAKKDSILKGTETSMAGGFDPLNISIPVPFQRQMYRYFGGPPQLKIRGSQKIMFSGKSEWIEGNVETSANKNSSFPTMTMEQVPNFNINGKIGTKVDVLIAQNIEQMSSIEDNIKLTYKGNPEEILTSVEAGNTVLSLPGAFSSYSSGHPVFGIKAETTLGPFVLTTIASQEKSKSGTKSFKGQMKESTQKIHDYEIKRNIYFFLDSLYHYNYEALWQEQELIHYYDDNYVIVDIEVYVDDNNQQNNAQQGTFAIPTKAAPGNFNQSEEVATADSIDGFFHLLEANKDYFVDKHLGYIMINRSLSNDYRLAVYLKTKNGRIFGSNTYKLSKSEEFDSHISLKLIKKRNQLPTDVDTWNLEWKNVYDLGQRGIDPKGFDLKIFKKVADGIPLDAENGLPYIRILGLDKTDESGNRNPDNKIDLNRTLVNFARGELIFPIHEPFNEDDLEEQVPEIYNTNDRQSKIEASLYYLEARFANKVSKISLPINLNENSETVFLNGRPLQRGKDYNINYTTGDLTILVPEATSAEIEIKYTQSSMFQPQRKSLVGTRIQYDFLENSRISSTILFQNETTKEYRIRYGEEPKRNLVLDMGLDIRFRPEFLTKAIDMLPLIQAGGARDRSSVNIRAAVGSSIPNANTKGMAFLDDFEGSRNQGLGISRTNWSTASMPDSNLYKDFPYNYGEALKRGNFNWYNPWNKTYTKDIWPNRETSAEQNNVHVLALAYGSHPDVGMDFNRSYGGIMQAFYGGGRDLSRTRYIEIWTKGRKGVLKVDLGKISEDMFPYDYPNGRLETEDKIIYGQGIGDGILTKDEDTGLDGLFSNEEPGYSAENPDPSGDDFNYGNKYDYSRLNNTEGNARDPDRGEAPDTEDINKSGILETVNAYYEYSIDFSDTSDAYLVKDTVQKSSTGQKKYSGWRLFRIPLWDDLAKKRVIGGKSPPDSTLIEFIRLWVTGVDTSYIEIATIELVESQWQEQGLYITETEIDTLIIFSEDTLGYTGWDNLTVISEDSVMMTWYEEIQVEKIDPDTLMTQQVRVAVANTDENVEYYPPPGVRANVDRVTGVREKEQSIVLGVEDLKPGRKAIIYRQFDRMDFSDYTRLKMFVHGDDNFPPPSADSSSVRLFIRFGGDKKNYYQYEREVFNGWDYNTCEIDIRKLTDLKLSEAYTGRTNSIVSKQYGKERYSLKGSPSITNVQPILIGLYNTGDTDFSGQIWLDELRLDELRHQSGTAYNVRVNTNLANFIVLDITDSGSSSDFRRMGASSGQSADKRTYGLNATLNADRLLPKSWGFTIPVKVNMSQSKSLPRLKSGSDIVLDRKTKELYKTSNKNWTASTSITARGQRERDSFIWKILNTTIFSMGGNVLMRNKTSQSPSRGNDSFETTANYHYSLNPKERGFSLFSWLGKIVPESFQDEKLVLLPNRLNYNADYGWSENYTRQASGTADSTKRESLKERISMGYNPLSILKTEYSYSSDKDLILDVVISRNETNSLNIPLPEKLFIRPNFRLSNNYRESNDPRTSISGMNINFSRNGTVSILFNTPKFIKALGGVKEEKTTPATSRRTPGSSQRKPISTPKTQKSEGDKDKAKKEEVKKPKKKNFLIRGYQKGMGHLSNMFQQIQFSLSNQNSKAFYGVMERPTLQQRLGIALLDTNTVIIDSTNVQSRQNAVSNNTSMDFSTSVNILTNLRIRATGNIAKDDMASPSGSSKGEKIMFPRLDFSWGRIEKYLGIDKIFGSITLKSRFQHDVEKGWRNNEPDPSDHTIKRSFDPAINISTSLFKKVPIGTSYSWKQSEDIETTGGVDATNRSTDTSFSLTISYEFKPNFSLPIPLLGRKKLKSSIQCGLDFTSTHRLNEHSVEEGEFVKTRETNTWRVSPRAQYQFSSNFTGTASFVIQNSKQHTGKVTKLREARIEGTLTFK